MTLLWTWTGGNSAARCWPIDQMLFVRIQDRIEFLSWARTPDLLSPFGKMSTGFRLPGSLTELGLKKKQVNLLRWSVVVSNCTGALVESDKTRRIRYSTPTGIACPSPASHIFDYMGISLAHPHHISGTIWAMNATQGTLGEPAKITMITRARIHQDVIQREVE